MPDGKPAGVRCVQLAADNTCRLFGLPERPLVCARLRPEPEMCGSSAEEALLRLAELERLTAPGVLPIHLADAETNTPQIEALRRQFVA
jgi:hypothetical protein